MVGTTVMEWLRTPLTIFRQAAWVETRCYALKVWYFQSRARSTSYCLTVNFLWNISTFCPTVAEDSHPRAVNDFKGSRMKEVPRCSCLSLSLSLSHYQLLLHERFLLSAPSLLLFHRRPRFVSTSAASCAFTEIVVAARTRSGSQLSSHGWFTVSMFFSHRLWLWGRTVVVTTTFWPILWVITEPLPWEGVGPAFRCMWRDLVSAMSTNVHAQ